MKFPKLFLIGAPKCGTTSLASWLSCHPGIFMCTPKEPDYYAPDVASSIEAETLAAYQALFANALPGQVLGEASTTYLRSRMAVPAILRDTPDARLVVCLRHPVDFAISAHAQLVRTGREPESDFVRAWALQETRRIAPSPRSANHNPADLLYREMSMLGAQVGRLLEVARREQVAFVLLEDIRCDPGGVYRTVLAHAGVADDGRQEFPVYNERRTPRSRAVARASHFGSALRRRLGIPHGLGLGRMLNRVNETASVAGPDPAFRAVLLETFREDIHLLAKLTGRDLNHWLATQVVT